MAVVGGGVVGVATAAALARKGRDVTLLERHGGPGRETSSRNSGVIHAGLYYPPGSLKARLCVDGRERLYHYCAQRRIAHRRTGKLVVATEESELGALEALHARAEANGAGAVALWDGGQVTRHDPALRAKAALFSPESGIVDPHGVVECLARDARDAGATLAFRTRLRRLAFDGSRWRLDTVHEGGDAVTLRAATVVDAAGLEADAVAEEAGLDVDGLGFRQDLYKGDYFVLHPGAPRPQTALVYPPPEELGLGVHLTVDLGGQCLVGPDSTRVRSVRYDVDPSKAEAFARSVARYLPGVQAEHLRPGHAGVRPRLTGPGFHDFIVEECTPHGAPGLICLVGIESPGLTAALSVAEYVAQI